MFDWVVNVGNGTNDDTANCPEHLKHLGSVGSQLNRHDLTAVCRSVCNEDTPWQTLEKLGYKDNRHRFGEIECENEDVQEHEAAYGCPTISDPAGKWTGKEHTNQGSELPGHLESRLPLCNDDEAAVGLLYAVLFLERR